MEEGVIKFSSEHEQVTLGAREHGALATKLDAWRSIFVDLSILGQDSTRYQGAGFGNLSGRIGAPSTPKGRRHFLISGTQTGHLQSLGLAGLCRVQSYQPEQNRVVSAGPLAPSSESMTHGAIYDLSPAIRFVFHVHAPKLWSEGGRLGLPTTRADVQYGTRAMAREVARLYRETSLSERRVFAMAGHEDGVISFGRNAEEAGLVLVCELARARQL